MIDAWIAVLRLRGTRWFAGVMLATGLFCTQLPLVRSLGYEFAAFLALITSFAGAVHAHAVLSAWRRAAEDRQDFTLPSALVFRRFAALTAAQLTVLSLPVAVIVLNALVVPVCAPSTGFLFLVLIPLPAVAFGVALAVLLRQLVARRAAYFLHVLLLILLLAHAAASLYLRPQLHVYNHLFGVFTGFSWDEAQPVIAGLIGFRVITLAWTFLLLSAARFLATRAFPLLQGVAAIICILIIAVAQIFSDDLGLTSSEALLRRALGAELRTPHFTIVYAPSIFDAVGDAGTARAVKDMGEECEYQLHRVCRALEIQPPVHVTVFVYPDAETKRRLLGTETSDISRPWTRQIHVDAATWRDALGHELVHVVAGEFGPTMFRVPVFHNYGLTEGLATAVAGEEGPRSLHEHCASLLAFDMLPALRDVIPTRGFFSQGVSLAYTASGSFCRWLIDTRGIAAMRSIYHADDVTVAGGSIEQLDREWRGFLRSIPRMLPDSLATLYEFRAPPIQSKVCPRSRTELNRSARNALLRNDFSMAVQLFRTSDRMAPNPQAALGVIDAMLRMGACDSVLAAGTRLLADTSRAYTVLPILLWMGDASAMLGDSSSADRYYSRLIREHLPGWTVDAAVVRRNVLRTSPVSTAYYRGLGDAMRQGGTSLMRMNRSISMLRDFVRRDSACAGYRLDLAARLFERSPSEAVRLLESGTWGECSVRRTFLLAEILIRNHHINEAERVLAELSVARLTQQERARRADLVARCQWMRAS